MIVDFLLDCVLKVAVSLFRSETFRLVGVRPQPSHLCLILDSYHPSSLLSGQIGNDRQFAGMMVPSSCASLCHSASHTTSCIMLPYIICASLVIGHDWAHIRRIVSG
jgi:hypothetical protein